MTEYFLVVAIIIIVVVIIYVFNVGVPPQQTVPIFVDASITTSGTWVSANVDLKSKLPVTIIGLRWSLNPDFTGSNEDNISVNQVGNFSYTFSTTIDEINTFYGRIYATNSKGTSTYDQTFSVSSVPCLVEGTLITLGNRSTKLIEEIDYDDQLLVWNFDEGCFDISYPFWIKPVETIIGYNKIIFSDNSYLKTVSQHRIFNNEQGKFTYAATEDSPIGTHTFNENQELIQIVSKESYPSTEVNFYNLVTFKHMNLFANGMLTSCRFNNIYPISKMKFVKEYRKIRPYELFKGVDRLYYDGFRLGEQQISVQDCIFYATDRMKLRKKQILFLDHQGVMVKGTAKITTVFKKNSSSVIFPDFDSVAVGIINEFLKEHPYCEIVVSSDWKKFITLEEMKELYLKQGINKVPIDYTPNLPIITSYEKVRTGEILTWLENHHVSSWLTLDDLDLNLPKKNFIRINLEQGLIEKINFQS
jgi:hypothetical protein